MAFGQSDGSSVVVHSYTNQWWRRWGDRNYSRSSPSQFLAKKSIVQVFSILDECSKCQDIIKQFKKAAATLCDWQLKSFQERERGLWYSHLIQAQHRKNSLPQKQQVSAFKMKSISAYNYAWQLCQVDRAWCALDHTSANHAVLLGFFREKTTYTRTR